MTTDKLREQISALTDDNLSHGEHELLIRRFSVHRELRLCWERYHVIGEAMRKGLPHVDTRGFADRVMQVLEGESPQHEAPRSGLLSNLSKGLAGMAVAASVAAVAVVGLRHDTGHMIQGASAAAPSEIVPSNAAANVTPASFGTVSNATWNGNTPDVQAELSNYLINHNEMAASLPQPSVPPYFYIATYDPRVRSSQVVQHGGQSNANQGNRKRR